MTPHGLVEVRFGGLGGQGLVTLGAVLAEAGTRHGLRVAASQAYGSRARGGATRSDVILSEEPIDFPHILHPDILVVLAQEACDLYRPSVRSNGTLLYDDFFVHPGPAEGLRQIGIPGTSVAMEQLGNKLAANFVMLGALIGLVGLVTEEEAQEAMRSLISPRFLELNTQALAAGMVLGQKAQGV